MSISLASFTLGLPLINRLADQSHSLAPLLLLPNQPSWARDNDESPTDPYRLDTIQLTIQRNIPNSRTLYQLLRSQPLINAVGCTPYRLYLFLT